MPRPKKKQDTDTNVEPNITKKVTRKARTVGGTFNLLDVAEKRRASALSSKASQVQGFRTAADMRTEYLPVPWPAFKWLTGTCGFPLNTISELIGEECVGKSSLLMSLLGHFVKHNIPSLYINSEPKDLDSNWVRRLMSTDANMAEILQYAIELPRDEATGEYVKRTYSMNQMDKRLRNWVYEWRHDKNLPLTTPLVVVIDSISRLLNPSQEEVALASGKKGDDKIILNGVADVGGQIGAGAKWLHSWVNLINPLLKEQNVTIICTSAQNANISGGASTFSADGGKSLNKSKTGGLALNQGAGFQLTVTNAGMLRKGSDVIGRSIKLRCVKNSYGPIFRQIVYGFKCEKLDDGPNYLECPIDMSEALGKIIIDSKLYKMTVSSKRYSSEELDLHQVTSSELESFFMNNPSMEDDLYAKLKISGYDPIEDEEASGEDNTETV